MGPSCRCCGRPNVRRLPGREKGARAGNGEVRRRRAGEPSGLRGTKAPGRGTPTACYSEPFGNIPGSYGDERTTRPSASRFVRPQNEHDSCGVGFVVDLKGRKSHKIVRDG